MASNRRTLFAAVATVLASVSLYPLFIGALWFWAGAGAVAAVAVAGTLTRRRRLPVAVCLAGGLLALLLYLNLVFAGARSWGHLVPTLSSLRALWHLAGQGFDQAGKYAPPVPQLHSMLLLAAAGIGITALLVDLVAVRLESAALAGLPLLLLFAEPFTVSVSRSVVGITVAFCAGVAGYLALLSSEGRDRIREWEQPNPGPDEMPDSAVRAAVHPWTARDPAVRQRTAGDRRHPRSRRPGVPRPEYAAEQGTARVEEHDGPQLQEFRHDAAVPAGLRA